MVYLRGARGIAWPTIQLVVIPANVCIIMASTVSPFDAIARVPIRDAGPTRAAKVNYHPHIVSDLSMDTGKIETVFSTLCVRRRVPCTTESFSC